MIEQQIKDLDSLSSYLHLIGSYVDQLEGGRSYNENAKPYYGQSPTEVIQGCLDELVDKALDQLEEAQKIAEGMQCSGHTKDLNVSYNDAVRAVKCALGPAGLMKSSQLQAAKNPIKPGVFIAVDGPPFIPMPTEEDYLELARAIVNDVIDGKI